MSVEDFFATSYTVRYPDCSPFTKKMPLPVGSFIGCESGPGPEVNCTRLLSSKLYCQRLMMPLTLRFIKSVLPGSSQANEPGDPVIDPNSVIFPVATFNR